MEYPNGFNSKFKRAIRKRDKYECAICGGWGNCVHHINYIKEDTHPLNCITLCKTCHGATNGEREYWRYKLTRVVMERSRIIENETGKPPPVTQKVAVHRHAAQRKHYKWRHARTIIERLKLSGVNKYTVTTLPVEYREIARLRKIPYIYIPLPDTTAVVISTMGKIELPESESDLTEQIFEWLMLVPHGSRISVSRILNVQS